MLFKKRNGPTRPVFLLPLPEIKGVRLIFPKNPSAGAASGGKKIGKAHRMAICVGRCWEKVVRPLLFLEAQDTSGLRLFFEKQ